MTNRIKILVVGGGPAGLSVISAIRRWRSKSKLEITLLEPSDWHYYQSSWLAYLDNPSENIVCRRHIAELLSPDDVNWVNEAVGEFNPEKNHLLTETGKRLDYDYLVVACGLQVNWGAIKGLHGKLGRDGITSILHYSTLDWTKKAITTFNEGQAIFTHPRSLSNMDGPGKEIMMLIKDRLDLPSISKNVRLKFYTGALQLYPVDECDLILSRHFESIGIRYGLEKELIEVRPKAREAIFHDYVTSTVIIQKYDFLHVVPPMHSPIAVAQSELADDSGLVDVDPSTLQHRTYSNIFALGDVASTPVVRGVSAITNQMPIVVSNIAAEILGSLVRKSYDGLNHQVILTGKGRGLWFKCKFMQFSKSPFSVGSIDSRAMRAFKRRVSSIAYWKLLLAGKQLPTGFANSHLKQL